VCNWIKKPLAAADDHQKRPAPFFVPVAGERFGGNVGEIYLILGQQPTVKLRSTLGDGLV
jgi:hypothetical protein